jgi:hypothetical protein
MTSLMTSFDGATVSAPFRPSTSDKLWLGSMVCQAIELTGNGLSGHYPSPVRLCPDCRLFVQVASAPMSVSLSAISRQGAHYKAIPKPPTFGYLRSPAMPIPKAAQNNRLDLPLLKHSNCTRSRNVYPLRIANFRDAT